MQSCLNILVLSKGSIISVSIITIQHYRDVNPVILLAAFQLTGILRKVNTHFVGAVPEEVRSYLQQSSHMLLSSILVSFLSSATPPVLAPKRLTGGTLPGFMPILMPGRALGVCTKCLSASALCSSALASEQPAFTNSTSCHHEDKYNLLHQDDIETTKFIKNSMCFIQLPITVTHHIHILLLQIPQ